MAKTHYRVEIFAKGRTGGGYWEDDVLISGNSPSKAYKKVIEHLEKEGFSYEFKATLCDAEGRDFQ